MLALTDAAVSWDLELDRIRHRLAGRAAAQHLSPDVTRRAAVATILRPSVSGDRADTEVLLIRRAERVGDPWSGHMAFPGGREDPVDRDLFATALRETREEVGVDLDQHEYLGQLDELPAIARGQFAGMVIAPYVFALRGEPRLTTNEEVAEVVWASLGQMARGEVDDIKELTYEGQLRRLPAYRVQDRVVWGLTHLMLRNLLSLVER